MEFAGAASPLGDDDITAEAQQLGVEPAAIWAVCDVESAGSGFLSDHRPKILFEAHSFHTLTQGQYDRSHPNISAPFWDRSLYGGSGAHQYDRLAEAIALNRIAALESASWGRFQIMGSNHAACGYADVEAMVEAMMESEANHLLAFGNFCNSSGITRFLVSHDWAHFALRYNGTGNVSDYAGKLANAYQRHLSTNGSPVSTTVSGTLQKGDRSPAVAQLQRELARLGYQIAPDGDFGSATEAAVMDFQQKSGLSADGVVGPKTKAAMDAAAP